MFSIKFIKWFLLGLYTVITIIPHYLILGLIYIFNPKKSKELKYKSKPIIPIIMIALSLSVYFICIFIISRWYVQKLKLNFLSETILESTEILEKEESNLNKEIDTTALDETDTYPNVSFISVDFDKLIKQNSETVAWIKVNNTNVNYSVVQHNDNDFYLKHDFNQNYNINGWIFADYRDDFEYFGNNTIIYGHNLLNRTMFGSLVWCLKESWYTNTDNQFIKLSTKKSNTIWKIFSIYEIKPEVYYLKTYFDTEEEHQEFVDTIHKRSIYNFNEEVSNKDKILTLQTCNDDGTKRIVIHAKLVKAEYR